VSDTFVDAYIKHTSIYESPISFWKWSSYATIAAILKDKCFLRQGDSFLFANMYVLFLAESSGHRKGRPVELSESMVNKINNTKVISGRASVQAILDELARSETNEKTGKVVKSSSAIFYAPELSAGIVNDPEALGILTDIYDYKMNPYKQRLRTGPCFNLERIVFSMLMASNEDMIKSFWDTKAIKGGMLARTVLVIPNEFRKSNSLMRVSGDERKTSMEGVIDKLREISLLRGEFEINDDALKEYEDWYNPFRLSYEKKKESSGIVGRIHTTVIKLAMILAANDLKLIICKCHIEQAINELLGMIQNYNIFTMNCGKTEAAQAGGIVLTDLLTAYDKGVMWVPRKNLLRDHWQSFDNDILDKIMVTLETAGMIRLNQTHDGILIGLTDSCLDVMGRQKKG
jgi:hypothetical protein